MFGQLIATLKKSPKTIVFTEGTDPRISQLTRKQDEQEHRKDFRKLQERVHFALECVDQANLYNKYKKHRKNDRSFSFHVSSVCGLRFVSCLEAILPHSHTKAVLSSWRYLGLLRSCSA